MHINNFPTELLEEIFLYSVSQSHSSPPFTRCSASPSTPCVISKICKRWNDIALNFAPLWTHLHVVDPQGISIVHDLEVWMHRAGTLPLCFSLRQDKFYDLEASAAVVRLFLKSLQRCQSFEMFIRKISPFGFAHIERVPSTSLESVNVRDMTRVDWINRQLLTDLLLNTRTLRTIRWSRPWHYPHATTPHPWENLRELSTDSVISSAGFLKPLSHCQNLERLRIHEQPYADRRHCNTIPFVLPRVTHLSVRFKGTAILSKLILPSLEELEMTPLHKFTKWTPIVDLLQRSGVVLRRFGVMSGRFSTPYHLYQPQIIRILKMPYFRELRILEVEAPMMAGCGIAKFLTLPTNGHTTVIEDNDESSGYLVHLEKIHLVFEDTGEVNLSRFFLQKLIESRLGMMSDPQSARWQIEITKQIRFSLSTLST